MDLFNISMKDIAGIAERNQADDIFDVPLVDPAMAEINAKLDKIIALLERPKKTCVRAASRYTPEFEELWQIYPKRQGSNPKRAAYHAVRARLKAGETLSVIREGVVAYRAYCDATGDTGGEFVMQAVRFFGTSQEYLASGFHALSGFYATNGHSHVIYSDDHGETWHLGGSAQAGTNESAVMETTAGRLYLNSRNYHPEHDERRAYAWSHDQGESFAEYGWDDSLPEPICQASLARYSTAQEHDKDRILFSNPASDARKLMTVRLSYDECQSWTAGKVLHKGLSAYSDLCVLPDMTICCLYERGTAGLYETLHLARFDLEWLTDGQDRVSI